MNFELSNKKARYGGNSDETTTLQQTKYKINLKKSHNTSVNNDLKKIKMIFS